MKKVTLLGLAVAGLLMVTSCSEKIMPPPSPPAQVEQSYSGPKQDVPMVYGILTLHPDSLSYKGKDDAVWSIFGDPENKCIVITQNKNLYPLFAGYLPIALDPAVPAVIYSGSEIDPLVLFTPEQVADISRRVLFGLNHFKAVKIMSYGTMHDLEKARAALKIIMADHVSNILRPAASVQSNPNGNSTAPKTYYSPPPPPKPTTLPNGWDPNKEL